MSPDTVAAGRYPIPPLIVDALPNELWRPTRLFWVFDMLLRLDCEMAQGRPVRSIHVGAKVVGIGRREFEFFNERHGTGTDIDLGRLSLALLVATGALTITLLWFAVSSSRPRVRPT